MIKTFCFVAACMLFPLSRSFSQNDSTRYINGLPVSEDDTVQNFPIQDLEPKDQLVALPPNALPADLVKSLEKDELYAGWRDSTVYYDANTNLYFVHVKREGSVKIFGLNENGKPVTFSEVSRPRD